MPFKYLVIVAVLAGVGYWLYSSGQLDSFFPTDEPVKSEISVSREESDTGRLDRLLDIIAEQDRLIDDLNEARRSGDQLEIRSLHDQFNVLEQQYQEIYNSPDSRLSSADAVRVAKQHRSVLRKLN